MPQLSSDELEKQKDREGERDGENGAIVSMRLHLRTYLRMRREIGGWEGGDDVGRRGVDLASQPQPTCVKAQRKRHRNGLETAG